MGESPDKNVKSGNNLMQLQTVDGKTRQIVLIKLKIGGGKIKLLVVNIWYVQGFS